MIHLAPSSVSDDEYHTHWNALHGAKFLKLGFRSFIEGC